MSAFVPKNVNLRGSLLFCFFLTKSAAESHRMLVEAYGSHALSEASCREWFRRFRCGDFNLKNEERGKPPKKFEDAELQALLDKDDSQTQQQLADQLNVTRQNISIRLKAMGKIQKAGKWVTPQLNNSQQENRRNNCKILHKRKARSQQVPSDEQNTVTHARKSQRKIDLTADLHTP